MLRSIGIVLLLVVLQARGQGGRIEVLHADSWEFDEALQQQAQRLKGAVRFKHADAIMSCDSAWLFEDQTVDAYSSIRIIQGDTLLITGDRLRYSASDKIAILEGKVRLEDPGSTLGTNHLVHDLNGGRVTYSDGGRIVSKQQGDTLTSRQGTYLTGQKRFIFSNDVVLRHPERTIRSDSLHYLTGPGIVEFHGPTTIEQEGSRISCVRGTYDTHNRFAQFSGRAKVDSDGQTLIGDSLTYDAGSGEGKAWGNVMAEDTANGTLVLGAYGAHSRRSGRSLVTGRAEMRMKAGEDTLFLHADSLFAIPDSAGERMILARRGVRFFKSDLQGACDTLIYFRTDSTIRMFHMPVLWSGNDQITGRHIRILLADGQVHRLFVDQDALMVSRVDSIRFDQVTGRSMTGVFVRGEIDHILSEGNSRTVYFAQEEKDGVRTIVGVNRADCSKLRVNMADGEVATVTFLTEPDAVMYPLEKIPPDELVLTGFQWRADERPVDRSDIFRNSDELP
ncbi:MAG: hypothetical protein KDB88_02935 [Flavobacteriales bacterium]|nr:hypothetical protein [Flavobacteriales bacterium]